MNWKYWLTIAAFLLPITPPRNFAQAPKTPPRTTRMLTNRDVLQMVRSGMKSRPDHREHSDVVLQLRHLSTGSGRLEETRSAGKRPALHVGGSEWTAEPS